MQDGEPTLRGTVIFFVTCVSLAVAMAMVVVFGESRAIGFMCAFTGAASLLLASTVAVAMWLQARRSGEANRPVG